MDTKGGRITIDIGGRKYSGRGVFKVRGSRVGVKPDANLDGTGYVTVKARLASLEGTFDRGIGFVWDESLMLAKPNVTFTEDDVGVTHLFTGASWSSEDGPEIDTSTGEVSGLSIHSDKYQQI